MKKKIYFVVAMGICFSLLMNCAKPDLDPIGMELEEGVPFGKKPLSMKRVDADKASEHPEMKKFINQVKSKSIKTKTIGLANQRNVNEIQTFKLQMTDIVMIEKGTYTSFTFAVIKDDDHGKMENIIVNYYSNGDVKSYLVMYDVNETEREMLRQGIMVSLDDKTETYLLENFIDQVGDENTINSAIFDFNMCAQWTSTQVSTSCPSGDHNGNNYNECVYYTGIDGEINPMTWVPSYSWVETVSFVPCLGVGGGFIPDPGGSNPPDNNENPEEEEEEEIIDDGLNWNITYPVPPKQSPHDRNCEKLAEMVANTGIRNSLNTLKTKVGDTREHGSSFSLDSENPVTEAQLASNSDTHIIMPYGGLIFGFSHTHPFETSQTLGDRRAMPMFSLTDIFGLGALAQTHSNYNADPSMFFLTLTVKNGSSTETYALKIENKQHFMNAFANYSSLSKDAKITKGNNLSRLYEETLKDNGGPSGYLKDMLTFLKNENIQGVGVYRSDDTNFSGWKKIILDTTGNNIDTIDCD